MFKKIFVSSRLRLFLFVAFLFVFLGVHRLQKAYPHTDEYSHVLALNYRSTDFLKELFSFGGPLDQISQRIFQRPEPSLSKTVTHMLKEEPQTSPLFYIVSYPFFAFLGFSALSASRLLSILLGLLSLGVVVWGLKKERLSAFLEAHLLILVLLVPPLFLAFTEARFYSGWAASMFASYFLLRNFFKENPSRSRQVMSAFPWLSLGLVNGLGLHFQPLHLFWIGSQFLFVFFFSPALRLKMLLSTLFSALILSPWILTFLLAPARTENVGHVTSSTGYYLQGFLRAVARVFVDLGASRHSPQLLAFFQLGLGLLLSCLVLFWAIRIWGKNRKRLFFFFLAGPWSFALFSDAVFGTSFCNLQRYLLFVPVFFVFLLVELAVSGFFQKFLSRVALSFFVFLSVMSSTSIATSKLWRTAPYGLEALGKARQLKNSQLQTYQAPVPRNFIEAIVLAAKVEVFRREGLGSIVFEARSQDF